MIITEVVTIGEEQKKHIYSDAGVYICGGISPWLHTEVFDTLDSDYEYTETDIPVDQEILCIDYASAYRIMTGDLIMDDIIERARALRKMIVKASESLSDTDALEAVELFDEWATDTKYTVDKRVRYEGILYKVIQEHTSQSDWTPDKAVSLFVRVDDPLVEFPEWIQPTGAHDAYAEGAKVSHNEKHWISTIPANAYEPGVYGWDEVA